MAFKHGVRISQVYQVFPSKKSTDGFSSPLTYLDVLWFKWHTVERVFFYEFPNLRPSQFLDTILPKLKTSLSTTLSHFPHLAGVLTWTQDSERPIIQYNPGDSVLLTVAESDNGHDFVHLSGDHVRDATALHPLSPKLSISDTQASGVAFQITLFPENGLSIGINFHHSFLDGKSSTMFMKAWAHVFKHTEENQDDVSLPPELTPVFDTMFVKDSDGMDKILAMMADTTNRSPKFPQPMEDNENSKGLVRVTYRLSRKDINLLKNMLASWQEKTDKNTLHLSSFVVTFAYVCACLLKTTETKSDQKIAFGFAADYRARLDPILPTNYGGNCTSVGGYMSIDTEDFVREDAVAILAEKISYEIREIDRIAKEGKFASKLMSIDFSPEIRAISVAGSPKLEVYGTDFGWGKPKKVEVYSIGKDTMALAEDRDNPGGLEIGLILKSSDVQHFNSEFNKGLNHSY